MMVPELLYIPGMDMRTLPHHPHLTCWLGPTSLLPFLSITRHMGCQVAYLFKQRGSFQISSPLPTVENRDQSHKRLCLRESGYLPK